MSDTLRRMAEIREQQGLEPMPDPGVIAGFGEGAPPPPPFPVRPPVDLSQVPDGPAEYFDDEEPESPLIPQPPAAPAPIVPAMLDLPRPDLAVAGNDSGTSIASYLGREVVLTEIEAVAVRRVVLKALQRQVRGQLAEVEALMPRRKRRARKSFEAVPGPAGAANLIEVQKSDGSMLGIGPDGKPVKRRRGRPRKVQPS